MSYDPPITRAVNCEFDEKICKSLFCFHIRPWSSTMVLWSVCKSGRNAFKQGLAGQRCINIKHTKHFQHARHVQLCQIWIVPDFHEDNFAINDFLKNRLLSSLRKDRPADSPSYRDARTQLISSKQGWWCHKKAGACLISLSYLSTKRVFPLVSRFIYQDFVKLDLYHEI